MNTRRYSVFQILTKVYGLTLKAVPFSGVTGVLNYLVQGLFPATTAIILATFFNSIDSLTHGKDTLRTVILYGSLFICSHIIVYLMQFISNITINAGIYERCTSFFNNMISEKASSLPLISYEDSDIFIKRQRAQDCVRREILSQIYMSSTVLITNMISVIATISVLATYSFWFLPISVFSVFPFFIARILRGKEFYNLKTAQANKTRRMEYLWSLLFNKQSVKEMRVMGFAKYIFLRWDETRDEVVDELWAQEIKDSKSKFP